MNLKWVIKTTAFALLIVVALFGLAGHDSIVAAQDETSKIELVLLDRFTNEGKADFIVRFTAQADLSAAYAMDWNARGDFVYNTLTEAAAKSQLNAKAILDAAGLKYQTFIAGNDLYVWGGALADANALAALPEVDTVRATRTFYVDPVQVSKPFDNITWAGDLLAAHAETTVGNSTNASIDWGILDTKADQAWLTGARGAGIKVANIDTGVQWNHPALVNQFACPGDPTSPNCWSDPSNVCGSGGACDNAGHGTHTMGTMVSKDDPGLTWIAGMAPDATWIACKGCESSSCSDFALNTCADWILAPGGNAANRPNVVNNSWGGGGGDSWYQAKVQAWVAAAIFPAFSAGNSTGCGSMGSPGDYQESFASTGHNSNRVHAFAQGPSAFGHDPYTKPNVTAPAVNICSTVPTNGWNCGYSGTSMASPHSAGAVAQIWSVCPSVKDQVDATFQLLQNFADPPDPSNPACGVPPDNQGTYEDGYGYLNVYNAVLSCIGGVDFGTLEGTVVDQNGDPVGGASVVAQPATQGNSVNAITDPNGFYTMQLVVGTYDVTASKVNYTPQTVNGVVIVVNTTTVQDFTINFLGSWTAIGLPVNCLDMTRYDGEFYPADGFVYFLGGRGGPAGDQTFGDVIKFDPVAHTCADTGANMPDPVSNYTVNLVNNGTDDVLCTFGGRGAAGTSTTTVQCYNPVTNTTSDIGDLPAGYAGFTPGAQVVLNNMVYIFGGFNNLSSPYELARTDRYDPVAKTFTQIGNLSLARAYLNAAVVDGKIFAFGGTIFDGVNLNAQTRAEVMADPAGAGTWDDAAVADLPTATAEGRAFGFNTNSIYDQAGKIIVAGGGQWPAESLEVFSYDVASNTYDYSFPDLVNARRDSAGFFVPGDPGAMWVIGGRQGVDTPPYMPPEFYPVNVAVLAPSISLTPPSLDAELIPDDTTTLTLTVGNEGNADLTWDLFAGAPAPSWSDNFDSYPTDFQLHGQGGWKGWGNVPAAGALTSDDQAHSTPNSVAILGASDLVHEYSGYTSGVWTYSAWQYIPAAATGQTYFILLNQYDDAGATNNWSLEVLFDLNTNVITNDGPAGGTLPILNDQWVEIREVIDFGANTQTFFYGGDVLFTGSWTEGMSGGGILNLAAVDLFANNADVIYYDDIALTSGESNPACEVAIPWLTLDPTSGTTLPGAGTPVAATFDSTGLAVGLYTGTVCAASNDPINPLVTLPVSLTVLPQTDLGITKTDSPDPIRNGEDLTYTLLVTNYGPQDATGVKVVDTLPAGVTFVSASAGCVETAGVVNCTIGGLAFNEVKELTIVVTVNVEGTITNTAEVAGTELDPVAGNNTATTDTLVTPAIFNIYLPLITKA